MEESYRYHHRFNHRSESKANRPSRLGLRHTVGGGGEIVEVQGGHIVRSTARKDRHSKVCTAKGPRDRRVRLSAHTAIQFYDVQDRLGYDRPSKAVDWLIKQAKASIDELAPIVNLEQNPNDEKLNHHRLGQLEEHPDDEIVDNQMGQVQNSSFLPASFDSIKSFLPAGGSSTPAGDNGSSAMQFHHNFPASEVISRTSSQNQDLKLSLQSFQDPIPQFDGSGWPEHVFNPPSTQTTPFFGKPTNGQLLNYISQRGTLQSNNSPPIRNWADPPPFSGAAIDPHQTLVFQHSSSIPGFTSGIGGFSGFHIPARFRGEDEEHDGISDKPSSASSDSLR